MPATSAVFRSEVIGIPFEAFGAGAWAVIAIAGLLFVIAELSGPGGGRRGMAGFGLGDRDQGQAQVACFLEQAMQRGLVGYRAVDGGGAVAAVGEGQPVEPR